MRDDERPAAIPLASGPATKRSAGPVVHRSPGQVPLRAFQALDAIRSQRVLGIVRANSTEAACELTRALWQAGLEAVEISVSTPGAIDAIGALVAERTDPRLVIGAGTIMGVVTARAAVEAGADLLVSPITDAAVIDIGREAGTAVLAGAATPGEASAALRAGADMVKLFPARMLTPVILTDILQAMPEIPLIPVGGIAVADVAGWLQAGAVAVGLGTSLTGKPSELPALVGEVLRIATADARFTGERGSD